MQVPEKDSRHNFRSFLWHAMFLALAQSFIDFDVILPSMIIDTGGTSMHVGLMTAVILGGASFSQMFFAPVVSNKFYKKKFLLSGINFRILSLAAIAYLLYIISQNKEHYLMWLIFAVITIYAVSGAFANLSYNDIIGKSMNESSRKSFYSIKQILIGLGLFVSAYFARKVLNLNSYPYNYMILFIVGASLLAIASGGFWTLREKVKSNLNVTNFIHFFKLMKTEIKSNTKLRNYLGFVNTQGISIAILPFIILYSKEVLNSLPDNTGNFLIFKIIGGVSTGILISLLVKKIKYNYLMYINVAASLSIVFIMLMFNSAAAFYIVFVLGGLAASVFSISMNGVLLEVSDTHNRALYTGISGAGYILPALFPVLGGFLIKELGFESFFALFSAIILFSLYFIYKMNCSK